MAFSQVLEETMDSFPDLIPKLDEFVVSELERKRRLYALSYRILIGIAPTKERRAALILQKAWTYFASLKAKGGSQFAAQVTETYRARAAMRRTPTSAAMGDDMIRERTRELQAAVNADPGSNADPRVQEQLRDINLQLGYIKRVLEARGAPRATA